MGDIFAEMAESKTKGKGVAAAEIELNEIQKSNQITFSSNNVLKNFSEEGLIKMAKATNHSEISSIVLGESLNLYSNKFKMNKLGMEGMAFEKFYEQNTALALSIVDANTEAYKIKDEGMRKAVLKAIQDAAKNAKTQEDFLENVKKQGEKQGGKVQKALSNIVNTVTKKVNEKMQEIAYKFSSAAIATSFMLNNFKMQKSSIENEMERIKKSKESETKKTDKIKKLEKDLADVKKLEDNVKDLKTKLGDALMDNLIIKRNMETLDKLMKDNKLDLKNAITAQSYDKSAAFAKGLAEIVDRYSKMDHNWDKLTPKKLAKA